ncbi:MAG: rhodanese-like domain-containing protein [Phycisphaerales bacterium JB060]
MLMRMIYDEKLAQAAYLIGCQKTGEAIVIDPERDVDRYIELARGNNLRIVAVAETHIHADFVSGAREMAERTGATVYVSGEGGEDWQSDWVKAYDHRILRDGDAFSIGNIELRAVHTPGHTPEHMVYVVTDHGSGASEPIGVCTGDFLFVGDLGRPDLHETAAGQVGAREPGARQLFESAKWRSELPEFVQVWPGHGAGRACGKALGAVPMSTVGYEKRYNAPLRSAIGPDAQQDAFVDLILEGQPEPPLYFARMKRVNRDGPDVMGELPKLRKLLVSDVTALDPQQIAIIDTRPWPEYRDGHLPGSMSFPRISSFTTDVGSMVRQDEDIYLIAHEQDVGGITRDLIRIGLDRVRGWIDPADVAQAKDLVVTREVDPDRAAELIDREGVPVLDVRRATEFEAGHIPGAENIAHTRLASRLEDIPTTGTLLVHCQGGIRSARACGYLQRLGADVINLKGGYAAWQKDRASTKAQ